MSDVMRWRHASGSDSIQVRGINPALTTEQAIQQALAEGLMLVPASNRTGYRGVHQRSAKHRTQPYQAQLKHCGKVMTLGNFSTAAEAALVYARKLRELELHGVRNATGRPPTTAAGQARAAQKAAERVAAASTTVATVIGVAQSMQPMQPAQPVQPVLPAQPMQPLQPVQPVQAIPVQPMLLPVAVPPVQAVHAHMPAQPPLPMQQAQLQALPIAVAVVPT